MKWYCQLPSGTAVRYHIEEAGPHLVDWVSSPGTGGLKDMLDVHVPKILIGWNLEGKIMGHDQVHWGTLPFPSPSCAHTLWH